MKILHVDSEKGLRGGERQVLSLMRGLRVRQVGQALAAREGSELARAAREEDFCVHEIAEPRAWLPAGGKALAAIAQSENPDLIHAHTGNAHTLAFKAAAGKIPVVVTRRVDFPVKNNPFSKRKYTHRGVRFIAISNGVANVLAAGGVPRERIAIVPSGVDPLRYRGATGREALRRLWGIREPGPLIGFVGAYVDHKDPVNLIEAFGAVKDRLPSGGVVFVGEGGERPTMEKAIRENEVGGRVLLTGWREDIGDCLAAFDLFVMPSKLEGLCTSLLDALSAGVPSIGTDTGGIPDVIRDGQTGLLVPPRDPLALGEAIVRLWEDEGLRTRLRATTPSFVENHFSIAQMVDGTRRVYERVVAGVF